MSGKLRSSVVETTEDFTKTLQKLHKTSWRIRKYDTNLRGAGHL